MKWKIFQWMKFLFRHFSNSRKLSWPEISQRTCVCIHCSLHKQKCRLKSTTTKGWRRFGQSQQRKSSELFPIQSEKSPDSGFFACDLRKKCIMPSSRKQITEIKGDGMIAGYCSQSSISPRQQRLAFTDWETRSRLCLLSVGLALNPLT